MSNEKKVTWADLQNATAQELKNTYGLNERGLEKAVRRHLDGADTQEMRQEYEKFYNKRR